MADIVFKYDEMNTAVTQIKDLASQYRSAAGTFESDFLSAIGSWEGDSKDKMSSFISGPVKEYMNTTVPKLLSLWLICFNQIFPANAESRSADCRKYPSNFRLNRTCR